MDARRAAAKLGSPSAWRCHGFTLIEIMVALALMAVMAGVSWRGIDGLLRAQQHTAERARELAVVQTALAQWNADLDRMSEILALPPLDWDGNVLRITRSFARPRATDPAALQVVAWSVRNEAGQAYWARWQSQPVHNRSQWQAAWSAAQLWSQGQGSSQLGSEALLLPVTHWQLYYSRGGGWTNPQSSAAMEDVRGRGRQPARPGSLDEPFDNPSNATAGDDGEAQARIAQYAAIGSRYALPEAVRLQIFIAPGHGLAGALTRDWIDPTVGAQL